MCLCRGEVVDLTYFDVLEGKRQNNQNVKNYLSPDSAQSFWVFSRQPVANSTKTQLSGKIKLGRSLITGNSFRSKPVI